MESKRILVTGGAGFMGSWLVDELVKRGHEVVSADYLLGGSIENVNKEADFVKIDLRDKDRTFEITKGIDIIFHLGAYAAEGQSFFSPIEINDLNLSPMNNLLVGAVNNNVNRFIFASSMAVYGKQTPPFSEDLDRRPVDPYGAAKTYCEKMLEIFSEVYGFEYVIIRPHNVYGPRQNTSDPYRNVLGIWINRILRNLPPYIYGDGNQKRAFSYIEDITTSLANAAFRKEASNQVINLGSDEVTTINQACRLVLSAMESSIEPTYAEDRPGEVKYAYCTIEKSMALLGYTTNTSLQNGLSKMAAWARKRGPQNPTYRVPLEIRKKAPRVWLEQLI